MGHIYLKWVFKLKNKIKRILKSENRRKNLFEGGAFNIISPVGHGAYVPQVGFLNKLKNKNKKKFKK